MRVRPQLRVLVTDHGVMSMDTDAAEAAARTVLRLLAVGDIEIVWMMLHVDYRTTLADEFMSTAHGRELLAAYGSRLHWAMFTNLARQRLLSALGPLPWAEADRCARTVDLFAADKSVVVTFAIDDEPNTRWDIEMTLTDDGWRWHNLACR